MPLVTSEDAIIGWPRAAGVRPGLHRSWSATAYVRAAPAPGSPTGGSVPHTGEGQRPNGWLTVILIDEAEFGASPETVRLALEAENIEARPVWKPMHAQPVFLPDGAYGSRHEVRVVGGAQSEALFRQGLCLPSGTAMDDDQIRRIATAIRRQKG